MSEMHPAAPLYTSVSEYMRMREGEAAPDDVTLATADPEIPKQDRAAAPPIADPTAVIPETPTPTPVSEAARVLSQHKHETSAQKRTREIQEQIGRETARKHAAKTDADAEEARLATLRAERVRLEATPPPVQQPIVAPAPVVAQPAGHGKPVPPRPEDVGTEKIPDWDTFQSLNQQFIVATSEWSAAEAERIATAAVDKRLETERQRQQAASVDQTFAARVDVVRQKHADFDALVFQNTKLPIREELASLIKKDPLGPDVAYYLGTHVEEADRIARLDPLDQAMEFGRLKTVVAPLPVAAVSQPSGPTPSALPVSKTPPPTPIVGGSSTSSQVPLEQRSPSEYIRTRNAELDRTGRLS